VAAGGAALQHFGLDGEKGVDVAQEAWWHQGNTGDECQRVAVSNGQQQRFAPRAVMGGGVVPVLFRRSFVHMHFPIVALHPPLFLLFVFDLHPFTKVLQVSIFKKKLIPYVQIY
jgi:hypothetical protein